ncbi:diguanylate cyclase/phosphodiesterase (GGDEF & EAL domains) with PAS/PAC sensor(s) [hydrothermal vent metagenome]|uniref:Diguanylate cyclase/phosphodiesterase (GGDEF & EAL domains) with PAS/PAC sensor(S) n=1 Tax=hydrothermal vent metagenome TaxID=652676 RepID=A0A3B0RTQ4_9ZZZZ
MRLLAALFAILCLNSAASAAVPMSEVLCTYSSTKDASINQALTAVDAFDCSDKKYAVKGPKIWVKIPFLDTELPSGTIEVQGDNNGLTTMEVHSILRDGSIRSSTFSKREVAESWRPKGYYGLPIPGSDNPEIRQQIQTVFVAIDNPRVVSSISLIQLASKQVWDDLMLPLGAIFGILCGMAIMPFFYNIFFYGALRYSFMLWHGVMIIGTVVYTFSSSGLIFLAFPETTLTNKFLLNYWTLALAVAASGFFLVRFVEPGKIGRKLETLILLTATLPVIVTAIVLQPNDGYNIHARNYYHASYLPFFFVALYTMVHAARRGSRAIWFQIVAWTPIILFGLDRVARGMDLYIGTPALDYGLYFMLVFETIVLAFGVANRIMKLRLQNENSLRKQVELTLLAETDGLTAIANRRAFEKAFHGNMKSRRYNHLAILDIDYFKKINDEYGHEVGDEVLRVAGRILAETRHYAARIGGEEFALLMRIDTRSSRRENPASEITKICENLIRAVHDAVPQIRQSVTFSAGVAEIGRRKPMRDIMAVADKRLYDAKNNGRNQVVSFDISGLPKQGNVRTGLG